MAKKTELRDRHTNEVMYPMTLSECILHNDTNLNEILNFKSYTIDFTQGTIAQEYNFDKPFIILLINLKNISEVSLTLDVNMLKITPTIGTEISANTLITWEISKITEDLPAAIGLTIKYYENTTE